MSHLRKALNIWTQSGHSQAEFAKITGIEQSLCSRIFAGSRGLTLSQRKAVYNGFLEKNLQQGLNLLKADLEDQTPEAARHNLKQVIEIPNEILEKQKREPTRVDEARDKLIAELKANDPSALSVAVALHDWRFRG